MRLRCVLFSSHDWEGCVCKGCGAKRDLEHDWEGCVCRRCQAPRAHEWDGCKCSICGKTRNSHHHWEQSTCIVCGKERKQPRVGQSKGAAAKRPCAKCGHPMVLRDEYMEKLRAMGAWFTPHALTLMLERRGLVGVGWNDICRLLQRTSPSELSTFRNICRSFAGQCPRCGMVYCAKCWDEMPTASEWVRATPAECPGCGERDGNRGLTEWPEENG